MENVMLELKNELGESNVLCNEKMKKHTSFKVGGCADYFLQPENKTQIKNAISILKKHSIPYYIMGNGTNLIVTEKGYQGAMIQIHNKFCHVAVEDTFIFAKAGALLSMIAAQALSHELTGFEFAAGIPGTLGGAVCMNAGAYDGEMKNVLVSAEVLTQNGEFKTYLAKELKLTYRGSLIPKENMIVLESKLQLKKGNPEEIKLKMEQLAKQRKEKQPLNFPSAGSTFKRPEGYFAGKLISDAGLKGFCIGGAQVSEKHAGFIINTGNATADDILNLIKHCQKTVAEKFGVQLETEVKIIGQR